MRVQVFFDVHVVCRFGGQRPKGHKHVFIISEPVSEQLTPQFSFNAHHQSLLGQTLVAPVLITKRLRSCLSVSPLLIAFLLCGWLVTSHVAQLSPCGCATINIALRSPLRPAMISSGPSLRGTERPCHGSAVASWPRPPPFAPSSPPCGSRSVANASRRSKTRSLSSRALRPRSFHSRMRSAVRSRPRSGPRRSSTGSATRHVCTARRSGPRTSWGSHMGGAGWEGNEACPRLWQSTRF